MESLIDTENTGRNQYSGILIVTLAAIVIKFQLYRPDGGSFVTIVRQIIMLNDTQIVIVLVNVLFPNLGVHVI